jgi:hypothetical protein
VPGLTASSADLHPANGARFVATRLEAAPLRYRVEAYLPDARRLDAVLTWTDGRAQVDPVWSDAWAHAEVLKLARVLKRTEPPSITRWRAREST